MPCLAQAICMRLPLFPMRGSLMPRSCGRLMLSRGVIEWSLVPKASRYFIVSTEHSTEQRTVSIRRHDLPQLFSNNKVPWRKDQSRFMRASGAAEMPLSWIHWCPRDFRPRKSRFCNSKLLHRALQDMRYALPAPENGRCPS
jgi:hypothetical protein